MGARWSRSAGLVTGSHVTRPEAVVSGGRSLGQSLPEFSQGPSAPPSRAESASLTPGPPGDTLQCQRHFCLSSGGERPRMHQHRPPQKGLGTLPVTPALPEPRMQRLGPCAPRNRWTLRWGFTNFISRLCTFVFCVLPEACQVRVRAAKCCCARPKAPTPVPARPALAGVLVLGRAPPPPRARLRPLSTVSTPRQDRPSPHGPALVPTTTLQPAGLR